MVHIMRFYNCYSFNSVMFATITKVYFSVVAAIITIGLLALNIPTIVILLLLLCLPFLVQSCLL